MSNYNVKFIHNGKEISAVDALILITSKAINYRIDLKVNKSYYLDDSLKHITCLDSEYVNLTCFINEWFGYNKDTLRGKELDEYLTDLANWDIIYNLYFDEEECFAEIDLIEKSILTVQYMTEYDRIISGNKVHVKALRNLPEPIMVPDKDNLTKTRFYDILLAAYPEIQVLENQGYQLDGYRLEPHINPALIENLKLSKERKDELSSYYNLVHAQFYIYSK
jgi:hypothetical protein